MHGPSGRVVARREWGVRLIKFYETALGDSRAEATLISGVIVPSNGGGRAIDLCERGIPRKYWSERPVAEAAAECWWATTASAPRGVGVQCVTVKCLFRDFKNAPAP
jgi:hypothetical protein